MKRIFFLSSQSLFGQGLRSLLLQEGDFDIVGQEVDVELAIERVRALRPDVVILDRTDPTCCYTPAAARILVEGLGTRVIGVNLGKNTMCIYHGEERVVTDVGDLVRAIENDQGSIESVRNPQDLAK